VRTVGYGSSFGGNPLEQHVGVGKAERVERVEVYWPTTGKTQTFRSVAVDRRYLLREGSSDLTELR
ncbi:MAG: ASPIC/UnbV domain-containing protein, partial [Acidobacteriota bacterium]|nr:ASPIC/UnbV domain-containing protein [Acidobacteriota bacterium]